MSTSLIKIPEKILVIVLISMAGLFGFAVYMSWKSAEKYVEAGFATEIKPVMVDGKKHFGSLRASIFYEENKFINSSAELVGNNPVDKELWDSHGPVVDLNNLPHQYTIGDMALPYMISKQANNDTIVVIKNNIKFRFKLDMTQD